MRCHVFLAAWTLQRSTALSRSGEPNVTVEGESNRSALESHAFLHHKNETGTAALDRETLWKRQVLFGSVIAGTSCLLLLSSICVLKYKQHARQSAKSSAVALQRAESGQAEVDAGTYQPVPPVPLNRTSGRDQFTTCQLEEELEDDQDALDSGHVSPEERANQVTQWAQRRSQKIRMENARYLELRKCFLISLTLVYICASMGLPYLHRREASCDNGFFWETHMEFLGLFAVTKCSELWLMVQEPAVSWDQIGVLDVLLKFLPSFMGFVDSYTDATAMFIAKSCRDDPLAQTLGNAMGIAYLVGICFFQWNVMFILSSQDPSQACLLKLLHMDMLANCVTLPADQKWVWNLLAAVRTIGEDMPQAILQIIYFIKVRRNYYMLISVVIAISASLKALYDAWNRGLAAAGLDQEYEQRERDFMLCSSSRDSTIRCWNVKDGLETRSITTDSPANSIAACNGMLYSSHDDDVIREWSLETGEELRSFDHRGGNAVLFGTEKYLVTWATPGCGHQCVYKVWSLPSGECEHEFPAPNVHKACMFVRGDMFFATSPYSRESVCEWDLSTGEELASFGHDGEINAIYATTKRIFTGATDATAKEWCLETKECTRTFGDHFSGPLAPLIVNAEKMYHASDKKNKEINEWSLQTGQRLRRFSGHEEPVLSLVMLDQKLYSSSEDMTIKQWSLDTAKCEQTFKGHTDLIGTIIIMRKDD
eukprot:s622_g19.t2